MNSRRAWWTAAAIVAVLALVASANSVANGFAYDDNYVLVRAARVHSLSGWWTDFAQTYWPREWGGDGYRPLTNIVFRVQWVLGGGGPLLFHAVNVVLHVAGTVAVLWMGCAILPFAAAFIAAALYAVHPVHTEAIANVVGQSELWVALIVVLALGLYLHGRRSGALSHGRWLAIGCLYAVACFFKEHGIVLPALILLAEFTVVRERLTVRERIARVRLAALALAAVGLAFLWARSRVVVGGGSGFVPYLPFQMVRFTGTDRVLTAVESVPQWFRLLLWPQRLTTEYSPTYVDIAQGLSVAQIPGLLVLAGTFGIALACWKRSPVTTLGIGWLALTLLPASNFIVPAGFIIAERTLLLPSVGAVLAIASVVPWLYVRLEQRAALRATAAALLVILIALGALHSYMRNRVWKNSDTLFHQGVIDSPDSYRSHYLLGAMYFERKQRAEGEKHFLRALELFQLDPVVRFKLAEEYRLAGHCELAIPLYRSAFTLAPNFRKSAYGLSACLLEVLDLEEAKRVALNAYRWGADYPTAHALVRAADIGQDSLDARAARRQGR